MYHLKKNTMNHIRQCPSYHRRSAIDRPDFCYFFPHTHSTHSTTTNWPRLKNMCLLSQISLASAAAMQYRDTTMCLPVFLCACSANTFQRSRPAGCSCSCSGIVFARMVQHRIQRVSRRPEDAADDTAHSRSSGIVDYANDSCTHSVLACLNAQCNECASAQNAWGTRRVVIARARAHDAAPPQCDNDKRLLSYCCVVSVFAPAC